MDKTYNHKLTEDTIYKRWEEANSFAPTDDPKAKPFTIIMPPPNANDPLHIGHAMFVTVEDILIRYHRMKGEASLWLPGTDHAGIETQFVYEKKLKKEDKSRFDFDRKTLYQMIRDYVQQNSDIAVNQLKKLGASADWSRFKFTLNPEIVDLVLETFQKLHTKGLIYRDYRLVNYCTRCGTGFSELEVMHTTRKDPFIYIKYDPFVIGTVRPETKFRDTALAVNPKDKRYKKYVGQSFEIMGLLGPITMKIVVDDEVDPAFGTGIMKVTPAHDFHDYELGKKHNLPMNPIIDFKGKMDFSWFLSEKNIPEKYRKRAEMYHGLHVSKMRPLMMEHLKEEGLLERVDETYEHTVSTCYRCGSLLEPLPLPQFYIKVKPLTDVVLKSLKKKEVTVYGAGHDKILVHWLKNLKDWNISRQIVWGIQIPVWYNINKNPDIEVIFLSNVIPSSNVIPAKAGIQQPMHKTDSRLHENNNKQGIVQGKVGELLNQGYSLSEIKEGLQELRAPMEAEFIVSPTSPGEDYIQETDTFDTWFSSGQWPYVTLKTTKPGDFDRFYPTSIMETGYDILPFWVMRMLMLGLFATGKVPFTHVYLHGLVRDEKGQKMAKSKGNVINPLEIIDKYGADALRMALVMSTTPGRDSATGENKIRGMRNFTNKIWNAARFIILSRNLDYSSVMLNSFQHPSKKEIPKQVRDNNGSEDKEFTKHLNEVTDAITKQLDDLKIGLAAETVYNEFWHWFCDEAIEKSKQGKISQTSLSHGLVVFLKLLHPFVPFVTEAVWEEIKPLRKYPDRPLMVSPWPSK